MPQHWKLKCRSYFDSLGNDVVAVGDDLVLLDVKVAVEPDGPVALLLNDGMVLHNDCSGVGPLGLGSLDTTILFRILVLSTYESWGQ